MRCVQDIVKFPKRMLWLVAKAHNVYCEERAACASDMLAKPELLDGNITVKIRIIFEAELVKAARTGFLNYNLW